MAVTAAAQWPDFGYFVTKLLYVHKTLPLFILTHRHVLSQTLGSAVSICGRVWLLVFVAYERKPEPDGFADKLAHGVIF